MFFFEIYLIGRSCFRIKASKNARHAELEEPGFHAMISPSCFSLGGRDRRGVQYAYTDKENIPHQEEDEDGPILYRDDDENEDDGKHKIIQGILFNKKYNFCGGYPFSQF